MRSYKPDKNITHDKLHDNDKAKLIAANIENIVLVAYRINGRKIGSHLSKVVPLGILCDFEPTL